MTKDELILKHFRKPGGYTMSDKEWSEHLKDALRFGCDWLHIMQEQNPLPAEAVEDMAERLEELESQQSQVDGFFAPRKG